jgi:hypothetical protein
MNPILFLFLLTFGGVAFAQDEGVPATEAAEEAAPADDAAKAPEAAEGEEKPEAAEGEEKPEAEKEGKAKADLPEVKVPKSDEEAIEDVKKSVEALRTGQWATFAVLLIGLLVFGWNRFSALKGGGDSEPK